MPLSVKALSKKIGAELLSSEDGSKLIPDQYYLPSVLDLLRHFVHLQCSPDPPHKGDMLRLFVCFVEMLK